MATLTTIDPTSAKAPILTQGDISPVVMMEFENTALNFFISKSVPVDKQVTMIIPGIKDLCICDWITTKCAHIVEMPFADFMTKMRLNYIPPDWEDQVCNEILTSTLTASHTSFWNWSQQLFKLNCLLHGTSSVFDEPTLHNHLEVHMDDELKAKVRHSKARKDKILKTWVAAVCLLDEVHAVETKQQRDLIEETLQCQAKHQNTNTDPLWGPSCCNNSAQSNTSSNTTSSSSYVQLPVLTDAECTLLNEHDGCTKCHHFYAGHRSQDCPNSFPVGKGYKTLTATDAMTAKKGKVVAKPISKPVAATSATIEIVDSDDKISAAVAILPESPGEYNSDSDEDWDMSCRDVSPPLHSKHLVWNCQVNSLTEDFPVKTQALIDNGALLVLIHPKLVDHLGLKKHKLSKPEPIDVAFSTKENKTELYDYVKLAVTSLDSSWTSCSVRAIFTLGLCAPIILGLPWLVHNLIVIDHSACTCIDKTCSYDLLNPPPIKPPAPPKLKICEQIKITKADKKLVLAELMMVCNDQMNHLGLRPEKVMDFDVAGAVRKHIEILATKEALQLRENKLKAEYKIIFEPIPHVDELPCDVLAEIHIKDVEKTIKLHSYPSPQKYKEAWQILIQQHLDAG